MAKYVLTNLAVEDLTDIWNYTFDEWSEEQADKYYNFLLNACQDISENPLFGKNYENVVSDLKGFRSGKHVIFYREISPNFIEVTRILHEKMDFKRKI